MSRLQIRYRGDEGYDGRVEAKLIGEFSGSGGFAGEPVLFSGFAQALAAFPLCEADPVRFDEGDVSFEVVPIDSVGHLRLTVELGDPVGVGAYVRIGIPTDYSGIASLREALTGFIRRPDQGLDIEI